MTRPKHHITRRLNKLAELAASLGRTHRLIATDNLASIKLPIIASVTIRPDFHLVLTKAQ